MLVTAARWTAGQSASACLCLVFLLDVQSMLFLLSHSGDALMDGSQAGFSSSVDNVFQQSLGTDTQQIGDWQVCSLHHTTLFT